MPNPPPPNATAKIVGRVPNEGKMLVGFVIVVFFAAIPSACLVGTLVLAAMGNPVAILLGFFALVFSPFLFRLIVAIRTFGRIYAAVTPTALWTRGFQFDWNDISAIDFVVSGFVYRAMNYQTVVRLGGRCCSLVVTLRDTDQNGRPRQYGYTLLDNRSNNLDEFLAAVRSVAPHVQFWWYFDSSMYVLDQETQNAMEKELTTSGAVWVRDSHGTPKITVDSDGATLDNGKRIPWADVVDLQAHANVSGGSSSGGIWSLAPSGTLVALPTVHRLDIFMRDHRESFEYKPNYQPPLEQVVPLIQRWAPHVAFSDRRALTPTETLVR